MFIKEFDEVKNTQHIVQTREYSSKYDKLYDLYENE
mgnify:CR=1 FL=1